MDTRLTTLDRSADLALLWGVAVVPSVVATSMRFFGNYPTVEKQTASLSISVQIIQELIGLGVVAYLLWRQGRRPADIGLLFRRSDVPLSFGIAIVAYIGYIAVFLVLPQSATVDDSAMEVPAALQELVSSRIALLAGLTVVNPIFEEVVVRAYPMIELEHLTGSRIVAVIVSAGVQGYYHLYQGWRWAVAATAMFVVFSGYFVYSKRAVPIILAHLYFDALGIYLLYRKVRGG